MDSVAVPRTQEAELFEGIGAAVGIAGAILAGLGWWSERRKNKAAERKEKRDERRSDLDIVLGGFERLLAKTEEHRTNAEKELAAMFERAQDCEERERALDQRVFLLEKELRRLGGNI